MIDSILLHLRLVSFAICTGLAGSAAAQDNLTAATPPLGKVVKFNNWTVLCPTTTDKSGSKCIAQLALIDSKRKIILVTWRIGYSKDRALLADVVTPSEVFIPPGVRLDYGKNQSVTLAYVSCGLQSCLSRIALSDDLIQKLSKASDVTISLAGTNRKMLQLKINATGLGDALKFIMQP